MTGDRAALSAILLLALAVRLTVLLQLEPYPRFEFIRNGLDDQFFLDAWAKSILHGQAYDLTSSPHEFAYWALQSPGVFPQAPLYPYFLAGAYSLFGVRYDLVRLIQMLCGVAAVGCIFLAGRLAFGATTGLVAALTAAVYGPFVFHEATFLIDSLTVFVTALMLYLFLRLDRGYADGVPSRGFAFALGCAVGVATLLRANFFLVGLVLVAWMVYRRRRGGLATAAWLAAGLALPLLPVVWVNTTRSGSLSFISSNGAYNFFIGNLPDPIPTNSDAYLQLKERSRSAPVDLWSEAINRLSNDPRTFAAVMLRKLRSFFGLVETPDNLNYYLARQCNPALSLAPLDYPAILPLAVAGLLLAIINRERIRVLLLFVAAYTASVTLFLVQSRLRQPAMIVVILFSAYALVWCFRELARRRWPAPLAILAATTAATIFLRPPADRIIRPADYGMAGAGYFSRAEEMAVGAGPAAARQDYVRALVLNPADDRALQRLQAMQPVTRTATEVAPETARDVERLSREAKALADAQRYDEAVQLLEQAIRLAPNLALPYQYLANVYYLSGNRRDAIAALEHALERDPTNTLFRENLKALKGMSR